MVADVIVFVFSTLKMGTQNPFGNVVTLHEISISKRVHHHFQAGLILPL
jgi:hypothetical protein